MATKRPRSEDLSDDIMTCPVCTNDYSDPRLLSCGHHFCFQCLEKIAKEQDDGSIPCPTCRHKTVEKMEDLKKYVVNEFQDKVSIFLSKKRPRIEKLCGFCDKSTPAAFTCRECHVHLCNTCREKHKTLERVSRHKVSSLTDVQFCLEHPDNYVHCICENCDKFLCHCCVIQHNETHKLADVKDAAASAKERLKIIISNKKSLEKDNTLSHFVKRAIAKIQEKRQAVNEDIMDLEEKVEGLLEIIRTIKNDINLKLAAELKDLEIMDQNMTEFIRTKDNLIQHVSSLLDSGSDCEIISREKEFPKYASDSVQSVFDKVYFEVPETKEVKNIANQIESFLKILNYESYLEPIIVKEEPLKPVKIGFSFKTSAGVVAGLAYDSNNDTYVVRTGNKDKLIQVFDTSGKIIKTLGSKYKVSRSGELDIDTKRNLYLLPTADGKIVTIDYQGKEENVIDVTRYRLTGISYCTIPKTGEDRYIVSSSSYRGETEEQSHSIYIVDPKSGKIIQEITRRMNSRFPNSVSSFFAETDIRIAAGFYRGGVKLYDSEGNVTNVLKGLNGEEVAKISGICSNHSPGIIVADGTLNAILYYCYIKDKCTLEKPRILFKLDDIKKLQPGITDVFTMAYDWKMRRILMKMLGAANIVFVLEEDI